MSDGGWFSILQAPSDVSKTTPVDEDILIRDESINQWVPGQIGTVGDTRYLKLDQTTPQTITSDPINRLIPELTSDPASPVAESAWVLRSGSGGAIADGTPIGLLLALTYTDNAGEAYSYLLKYRTKENTTLSVALT
jgi:hypothetical protein